MRERRCMAVPFPHRVHLYESTFVCSTHSSQEHKHRTPDRHTGQRNLGDIDNWPDRDAIWPNNDNGNWSAIGATPAPKATARTVDRLCLRLRCLILRLWRGQA